MRNSTASPRAKATLPSLVEDLRSDGIELLIHTGSILVVQVTGGDSSPVCIAQFQKGKPVPVSREDSVGGVSYSEEHPEHGDYASSKSPKRPFPVPTASFPNASTHYA